MGVEDEAPDEGAEVPDEDLSLEATVAAAFDARDKAGMETPAPVAGEAADEVPSLADDGAKSTAPKAGPAKDPVTGKFTKVVAPVASKAVAPKAVDPAASKTVATPPALAAPQSWKPTTREKWASLPPEIQQEVVRREKEVSTALQEAAGSRKVHQDFQQTISPYEGMIRAEGHEPMRAVGDLLQQAAALRMGHPQYKAQVVADIVKRFGVPIDALDAALSGQVAPQGQSQQGQYRDPRVDDLLSQMKQASQQRAEASQQRGQQTISAFGQSKEFFEDVRHDMADILEGAGRRGVTMTLDDAYNKACRLNEDVWQAMQQREAAKAATNAQASTQRTKAAASSIKGRPVGPIKLEQKGEDLNDVVDAAFAAHGF